MSEWKLTKLHEFANINPRRSVKKGTVVPFIAMTELVEGARDIPNKTEKAFGSGTKFVDGDTLFARITPCLENGKTALVSGLGNNVIGAGSTEFIVLNPKNLNTDKNFIYYLARLPELRTYAEKKMEGTSGRQRVSAQVLGDFEFMLPPPETRKNIGEFLANLDDKINANTRMNQTLEKIAQRIFKSWFIDFDPVKANAEGLPFADLSPDIQSLFPSEFVESEMGLIPKGWEVKSLGDVSTCYDSKRVPLSKTKREQIKGIYPYYGATSLMGHVNDYIFDGVYVLLGEDGSVIKDDNTPFIQYVWGKIWVNNHAHVLQGTESVSTEQLMLHLQRTNVSEFITGAVQLKINQSNMNRIPFIKANSEINEAFQKIVEPMYKKLRENHEQTQTLIKLRDRLLPKLLSGSIEIKQELDEAS